MTTESKSPNSQSKKFKEAVRDLEYDDAPTHFDERIEKQE